MSDFSTHPGRKASVRELLAERAPLVGPGVWDCLSARMVEAAGFPVAFLSGYCLSATLLGKPDFGFVSEADVVAAAERIAPQLGIPLIVDIDTGYGGPFNVERVVERLVRVGAAGCFLEDQVWPKRCGHMESKRVVPIEEQLPKLRAALRARGSSAFFVTARTDARAVLGLDEAIHRACVYRDEGVDAVFVEAPLSTEELARVRHEVRDVTLVANMVERGKTPLLTAQQLHDLGYDLIAQPLTALLAVTRVLERILPEVQAAGTSEAVQGELLDFPRMNQLLGLEEHYERERGWVT